MVDSRAKGARGEYLVRDMLREHTGLKFERVPASGALEYLKGDLYVPNEKNIFCIEVKNYSESPLNDKMFTAEKTAGKLISLLVSRKVRLIKGDFRAAKLVEAELIVIPAWLAHLAHIRSAAP